jgi:6-phosphogluconate dehydrogenase
MQIGIIGLGKMGSGLISRLISDNHEVVAFDTDPKIVETLKEKNVTTTNDLNEFIKKLKNISSNKNLIIWVMVPSGKPTEDTLNNLKYLVTEGDIIIDGGNSYYKDSIRRYKIFKSLNIHFLDVGTSGGIWGPQNGYCLMIGGEKKPYEKAEPIFKSLSSNDQKAPTFLVGPSGSGHFVKMIHNGIEYGMMQSIAEGFELLKAKNEFDYDLPLVAQIWEHGSVVRSWLLDLTRIALENDPELKTLSPYVEDSGEGRWTIKEAIDLGVPAPSITTSIFTRFASREKNSFSLKVLAALRQQFGGHSVKNQ